MPSRQAALAWVTSPSTSNSILKLILAKFDDRRANGTYVNQEQFRDNLSMAERVGFEPTVEFPLHSLSRRALSTAQTPLRSGAARLKLA
jgi:hypothetical protein